VDFPPTAGWLPFKGGGEMNLHESLWSLIILLIQEYEEAAPWPPNQDRIVHEDSPIGDTRKEKMSLNLTSLP